MTSAAQTGNISQTSHEKATALTVPSNPTRSAHSGSPSGQWIGEHSTSSSSPVPKQKASRNKEFINFIVQWTCGILAAAAAIVFGIWAPLSYEATASGNHSNDAAQSSMVDALSSVGDMAVTANSIGMTAASMAKSAATAQSHAFIGMQNQLALMGQLAVIDFCIAHSTLTDCTSYNRNENLALSGLVASLGFPFLSTTAISTSDSAIRTNPAAFSTSPASAGSTHGGPPTGRPPPAPSTSRPVINVGAILGIVFGSLVAVGAILAFLIWRYRYARKLSRRT